MASQEIVETASTYVPKVATVLLPAAYGALRRMRNRPLIVVSREGEAIVVSTPAKRPIKNLALRLLAEPQLTTDGAVCLSKEFTGYRLDQASADEYRACFQRFGRRDRLVLSGIKRLSIEVVDSLAIPTSRPPSPLLHVLDAVCLLAAIGIVTLHAMPIIGAYWADMGQQQSGTVNEVLLEFLRLLGIDITLLFG